ncbi:MAG: hypothetical protein JWN93_393 [Hyphomicrobiales bacterium]|nr:hypothetical protein [Hyphomicrobiales bacterium]
MSASVQTRAPRRLVTALAGALALALSGVVGTFGLSDALSVSRPGLSLMLDSGQADARMRLAQAALDQEPPDFEQVRAHAREALAGDPLAPAALTLLGLAAEEAGDLDRAEALMRMSARTSSRDAAAHAWLLSHDIRKANPESAVARLDWILRTTSPARRDALFPILAPLFDDDTMIPPLARLLAQDPPWRERLLLHLVGRRGNSKPLWTLVTALQSSAVPPTQDEFGPYLDRLVAEGSVEAAYAAWLAHTPPERLSGAGLLYNARFQHPLDATPFDWVPTKSPGVTLRLEGPRRNRIVNLDFFGTRIANAVMVHLLMLAPGEYRFVGAERARGLLTDRGLRWKITCVENADAPLAVTQPMSGDAEWRPIAMDFDVPEACRAQTLMLELPARGALERVITGSASYTGLGVEARPESAK